ncbi:glycosyltransferase family 61 protein [Gluconobacter wancherniae]|uniref:glycosyltransferase family 61 protein n=1 Tax=Gluconobacter wancherniae TaxID=1307955 RepID=UPI001B8C816D|nr:glycosyltransferase 61 family protein [Gluconobacter wancherniae]MBS1089817.1 glycosyltransferase family 61 protein [Gluconobacter wancherniae]
MPLIPAHTRKHNGSVFCGNPQIIEFQNVVFHPGRNHLDAQTGVYSKEGLLLHSGSQYHKFPAQIKRQNYWIDPSPFWSYPEYDDMIYGGHIVDQYGHFLIEFISRVYQFVNDKRKILVKCNYSIENIFQSCKWMIDVLSGFGIDPNRIIISHEPIRIKNLALCSPAMSEQMYCYDGFVNACQRLSKDIPKEKTSILSHSDIIYISRSKLNGGTVIIENESKLDNDLINLGVKVIYPEFLSFSDQVNLFKENRVIIGQVGTGFHNSIFSKNSKGIALNTKNEVDSNFLIIDNAGCSNIQYVYSDLIVDIPINGVNCYFHKSITDTKKLANDLFYAAKLLQESYVIPNMGKFPTSSPPIDVTFSKIIDSSGAIITVDKRTQEVSSVSGNNKKFALIMKIVKESDEAYFLVSEVGGTMRISGDIEPSSLYPVEIDIDENEGCYYIKSYDGNMLRSPPNNNNDQDVHLNWSHIRGEWEKFYFKSFDIDLSDESSHIPDIINIVNLLLFREKRSDLEYYIRNNPGLVAMIDKYLRKKNKSLVGDFLSCLST